MPSDTVVNPREYCSAITTRSGKVIEPQDKPTKVDKEVLKEEETKEEDTKKEETPNYDDVTYFGGAINRNKKTTKKLPSGFSQPDPYAKAPYPLLQKHKLRRMETIALTEESSVVIKKGLPSKVKDPGRFSIPVIGNVKVGRALCDLGASVNFMPLSFAQSLGITELKSTLMSLQFADRSIKRSEGVLEDVLVKIDVIEETVSEKILEEANPPTVEDQFADILHSSELLKDDQLTEVVKAIYSTEVSNAQKEKLVELIRKPKGQVY
ncbi:uncharacterized protein LOC133296789 [Gastrolobium bilobum]|uniref:uncharacterized protein LOC133296789 n=1 Tax=Gastrolobium bilobum TaxID=150636 RepID=UPI002AB0C5C1|nr:uncharacterized protein LOC133296789 [Gastrolobium bilobum]